MKTELEIYLPMRKACEVLGVVPLTLRRWEKAGKIRCIRTPSGQRRYARSEILRLLGEAPPTGIRAAVYARVSSVKQAGDGNLDRQRIRLEQYAAQRGYDVCVVIAEQGSGLNEKRKGLDRIFRMAREGKIDVVVIEFKDRLARFGYLYIEKYLDAFGVRVDVVNGAEPKSLQEELVADMLSILSSFSARLYGHRSKDFRKKVREAMADVQGK
ncbi:IS607 family transposase [Candidatus Igneacidithiobacillus taiwanensis]|uniref:IS607 family transposase n=1 Tax=Candidatus Igneacidithiobacillus taiwanensis TaxID=1945924 RepID=UPI0028971166|nr:IS607 family transposase [Candidatus Igneacidithiobacillus taiwanensis]